METHRGPLDDLERDSEETREYIFPANELKLIDHWVTFQAFETKQLDRRSNSEERELTSISLPMPINLATAYLTQYDEADLGAFGKILVDATGATDTSGVSRELLAQLAAGAAAGGIVGGAQGMTYGALGAAAFNLVNDPNSQIGNAAGASVAAGLGAPGQAILANQGIAVNPHKVLLFQGVGFREHQFSYQFTPKSYAEAETLKKIIYLFKYHGAPSFEGLGSVSIPLGRLGINGLNDFNRSLEPGKHFFKYPDYFKIKFHHPEFLFGIGPSVLESCTIDYQPAGQETY